MRLFGRCLIFGRFLFLAEASFRLMPQFWPFPLFGRCLFLAVASILTVASI
jgi:hypothetical protein